MAKMRITFDGFKDLMYQIDKAGGSVDYAARIALNSTQKLVQEKVTSAAAPYAGKGRRGYATGAMYSAIIKDARVTQKGSIFEVPVGFDLKAKGGWHQNFVLYGTPYYSKDAKLYNAIKGTRTQKEIAELQEKILMKYLAVGGRNK